MRPNTTTKLLNDVQVYKDPSGTLFKIVKKDETPKPMPENRIPFPDTQGMEMITQHMSERTVMSGATRMSNGLNTNGR
jgi:hypothetical protein